MPTGFQVINDGGILQIDETFVNMVLVQRGTATTSRPGGLGTNPYQQASYFSIPYPVTAAGRQPMLALRSNALVCYLTTDNGFTVFGPPGGASIEYFVYDKIGFGNPSGNVGLQVFSESGAEIFNTNNQYMRVLDAYVVELAVTNPGNPPTVPTYSGVAPQGTRVAVCMGVQSTGHYIEGIGTPTNPAASIRWWQGQCVTPTDNSYTISNSVISAFAGPLPVPPGLSGAISPFNSGLIIDVAGVI